MKFNMSKDDCDLNSSDSAIEEGSKKRKIDEDDSPESTFCCYVCDCKVSGDLAMRMHINSTQHKANTLKKNKSTDSIPAADKPTDSIVVTPKPAETIPTTATSSISIPDSSTPLQSSDMLDTSVRKNQTLFNCSVCKIDVFYSNDNLSFDERKLERQQHSYTKHKLPKKVQTIICTLCKCRLSQKHVSEHKFGRRHRENVSAMGLQGVDSGIVISYSIDGVPLPDLFATSVTVPVVDSQPAIEPPNAISTSSTVSEDSSQLEVIESTEVVPHLTFYCNVCRRELCGQKILDEHLHGRCHASNVPISTRTCVVPPADRLSATILNGLDPRIARMAVKDTFIGVMRVGDMIQFHCILCKSRKILGRQELDKHLQSDLHKKKLEPLDEQNDDVEIIEEVIRAPSATPAAAVTKAPPASSTRPTSSTPLASSTPPATLASPVTGASSTSSIRPVSSAPPATWSVRGFYCDTCAIYDVNCELPRDHFLNYAHKKAVAEMARKGAGAVIPPRGSEEWVARLPPNVAYCTVCLYAVFHRSMIYEHRRSEPHKKLLTEMGIQFDEDGIPTALAADSDENTEADVEPCTIDPDVSADWFFGFSVVDDTTEEQANL